MFLKQPSLEVSIINDAVEYVRGWEWWSKDKPPHHDMFLECLISAAAAKVKAEEEVDKPCTPPEKSIKMNQTDMS